MEARWRRRASVCVIVIGKLLSNNVVNNVLTCGRVRVVRVHKKRCLRVGRLSDQ